MTEKAKKGHLRNATSPLTQERGPMPSLKVKKPKKTSRGK